MRPIQDPSTFIDHIETSLSERDLMDLLARFDDAAIRTDLQAFRSLWTEDAVWEIGDPLPMTARGPEAIVNALKKLQDANNFFFRMSARPVMNIDGDTAWMRSPTMELASRSDGKIYANVAFYEDHVQRGQDGQCRFTRRTYQYIWVDVDSAMPGQVVAAHHPGATADHDTAAHHE